MSKKRILLVDDEPNIRTMLGAVLEQSGYIVDVAEDGFHALREIQKSRPELVITDLRMPNMNGFELLSVVRQRFPEIPTIIISGEFLAYEVQEGPLADAFFQKGHYSIPQFLDKISELVSAPRSQGRKSQTSPIWTSTGSSPVMLTCIECLRSFPIDPCDNESPKHLTCIFCGSELEIQIVAVGLAHSSSAD